MKKLVFIFPFVIIMMFFIFSTKVNAADFDLNGCKLYIGGKEVTKTNLSGDGWSFDPATRTITLNNFDIGTRGYYIRNENKGNGTYRKFAIIYVDDTNGSPIDLIIRSTGNNTNYIGDAHYASSFYTYIDGLATAFCGIYNPNGNVTIVGSTELKIGTHLDCVNASSLTVDTNCWIYTNSYTCAINVKNMTVKGNGKVSALAYCATSSTYGYNSTIYSILSLNVYDNAVIHSEMYRDEKNNNYAVNSIYSNVINARGGSIRADCYANGPKATKGNGIDCISILVKELNVSGGALVEAYLYNTSRKTYVGSAAIGHVYPEDSSINIQGAGIIRTGIQMKRPSGNTDTKEEALYSISELKEDKYVHSTVSNNRPKEFENFDRYEERVASQADGIYFRNNSGVQEWSYFRDFRRIEGSGEKTSSKPGLSIPSLAGLLNNVSDILSDNPKLPVYVLSGKVILNQKVEGAEIQKITVEGGTLSIVFSGGKKCKFTQPIEIKSGAVVTVEGDGIADGLNVIGEGKIKFYGGTVTGSVYKPVDMVVDGGNINVKYYEKDGKESACAYNSKGQKVYGRMHTISSNKVFEKVNLIRMKEREYGSIGIYPFAGNTMCIWTLENSEVTSARATYQENGEHKTISLYKTYNFYELVEASNINANYSSLHSVKLGSSIVLYPFNTRKANISSFNLEWSYSDDGFNWIKINSNEVNEYGEIKLSNVPAEYNERKYRCEIYSKYENELLDVFYTDLYVYNSKLVSDTEFVDGKTATIRIAPDTPIPESLYFRSDWYYSEDDGKSYSRIRIPDGILSDKMFYTFNVEDYMDGWIIKCESIPHIGRFDSPEFLVSTITINVIEKKVRIEEQPQGLTFANYNHFDYAELTVKARNATKYQWQVSKRPYVDRDVPFEDIPGENSPTYKFKMDSIERNMINYFYRCVITNEYGEVITDEVTNNVHYKPLFNSVQNNMSVGNDGVASIVINIDPGNPTVANSLIWKVSRDNAYTFETLSEEIMGDVKYDVTNIIMKSGETGITYSVFNMLEIKNPTDDMNGWVFGAFLYTGEEIVFECRLTLTILSECQVHGHDWLPATCTELSRCSRDGCVATTGELSLHTGGIATCIEKAKCEICESYYGELDPSNHCGTDKWNEEELDHSDGHESTWSCCGKPKHSFENHKYHEGICTVCNYICDHPIVTESNCHERKHCHVCQMDFGSIDPNNHDLSLGTYVADKKEATCEENGYTGDVICWSCMMCITTGTSTPAKGHDDGWPATCKEPAYCNICNEYFGNINQNNHAEWSYFVKNDTTHEKHWICCSMVTIEDHDFDDDGVCKICLYGCKHTGGIATCIEEAICDKCGDPYGDLDHNNHIGVLYYNIDENTHTGICACGKELISDKHHWENGICSICDYVCNHTGGIATCIEEAICDKCGYSYGDLDHNHHSGELVWNRTSTTHSKKWDCCNVPSGIEEEHTIVDGVCTICYYGCKHSGGTATCIEKAICTTCGEEYGEMLAHEDNDHDHKCDTCEKELSTHTGGAASCKEKATCTICGEKYGEFSQNNHTDLEHIPAKPATSSEDGTIEYWHCHTCDKYYSNKELTDEITRVETIIGKKIEDNNKSKVVVAIAVSTLSALGVAGGIIIYLKKKKKII